MSRLSHHKAGAIWWGLIAPIGWWAFISIIGVLVGKPWDCFTAGALVCISGWLHGLMVFHHCLNVAHLERLSKGGQGVEG